MSNALTNLYRLARAGLVCAEFGVRFVPPGVPVPFALRLAQWSTAPLRWFGSRALPKGQTPLAAALTRLGPSYIKAGQFLAARPDLVGAKLAGELKGLQDRMPPFPLKTARTIIASTLGKPVDEIFAEIGPPVAAASVAQVHKGTVIDPDGTRREVAIKVLRPGIEARFAADMGSFYYGAGLAEYWHPPLRRLKPTEVVRTLDRSMTIETDLRMEAAAISEMANNIKDDAGFRVPSIDWQRTGKEVLTIEWIDGIGIADRAALVAADFDPKQIGEDLIRRFLRHAMRWVFPRRHASGQSIRGRRRQHRCGGFRHHGAVVGQGAAVPGGDSAWLRHQGLRARSRRPFCRRVCPRNAIRCRVCPGLACHRRAVDG